jgi:hypothetical protein
MSAVNATAGQTSPFHQTPQSTRSPRPSPDGNGNNLLGIIVFRQTDT